MSDSGFSGLPPGQRVSDVSFPPSRAEMRAQIIEARGDLRDVRRPVRVEGEVVRHNRDGTIHVKTTQGELDLKIRSRDIPEVGQTIEIDIPVGRPPRQVTIRHAPPPETPDKSPSAEPLPAKPSLLSPVTQQQDVPLENQPQQQPEGVVDLSDKSLESVQIQSELVVQVTLEQAAAAASRSRFLDRPLFDKAVQLSPPPQIALEPDTVVRLVALSVQQVSQIVVPQAEIISQQVTSIIEQTHVLPEINVGPILQETKEGLLSVQREAVLLPVTQQRIVVPPVFSTTDAAPVFLTGQSAIQEKPSVPVVHTVIAVALTGTESPPVFQLLDKPSVASALKAFITRPLATFSTPAPAPVLGQAITTTTVLPERSPETRPEKLLLQKLDVRVVDVVPSPVKILPVPLISVPEKLAETPGVPVTVTTLAEKATAITSPSPFLSHFQAPVPQGTPPAMTGHVVAHTPQALPVIALFSPGSQTPQNFIMHFNASNLLSGAEIQFVPQPGRITSTSPAPDSLPALPVVEFFSGFQWPALQEVVQTLQQTATQTSIQAMARVVSNPTQPTQLPAAALFFIAAVRSGDISNWLGEKTVDTLRRAGKGEALNRISRDFSGLNRLSSEPVSQDWRAMALPMVWQGEAQKMHLYYREDGQSGQEQEDKKRTGTRFVFDLTLNRMGDIQLDGLMRPGKLDLVVRTLTFLSQPMQQAMRRTYINAIEQTDLTGEISFQGKAEQFVKIDIPQDETGVSV